MKNHIYHFPNPEPSNLCVSLVSPEDKATLLAELKEINETALVGKLCQLISHWPDSDRINRPNWFVLLGWFLGRGLAYPDAKRLANEMYSNDITTIGQWLERNTSDEQTQLFPNEI